MKALTNSLRVTGIAAVLLATGCAAASQAAADSQSGHSDAATTGSATGHIHLTGAATIDRDFGVSGCIVGPAGTGLLSGYRMTSKDGSDPVELVAVAVKDYSKDGSYAPPTRTAEGQAASAMTSGIMGPLTVMVSQGEGKTPLTVMLAPDSTMTIQISDAGGKGDAEFTDMSLPLTAADINPSSSQPPQPKKISGSVTWSCDKVEHLDPKMSGAVDGMFNAIMATPSP